MEPVRRRRKRMGGGYLLLTVAVLTFTGLAVGGPILAGLGAFAGLGLGLLLEVHMGGR